MAVHEKPPQRVKNILSSFLVPALEKRIQKGNSVNPSKTSDSESLLSDHWDKDAFDRRVETFTTVNWLAKPADVSPLECARYGWENTGADMMKCVSCKAILCGQLPKWKSPDLYRDCHRKLRTSLVETHKDACPWRNNPSPASFLTICFENREETLQLIQETYDDFVTSNMQLPVLSFETLDGIGLEEITFHDRAMQVYQTMGKQTDFNFSAFSLALFGWKRSLLQPQVIVCERCRRQVGLWSFRCAISRLNGNSGDTVLPHSPDRETNGSTDCDTTSGEYSTPKAKKIKLSMKEGLDLISEHRVWCPWVIIPGNQAQQFSPTLQRTQMADMTQSTEISTSSSAGNSNRLLPAQHQATNAVSSDGTLNSPNNLLNESDSGVTMLNASFVSEDSNHSLQNSQFSSSSPGHQLCDFSPGQKGNFMATSHAQLREATQLPPWQMLLLLLHLWKPENRLSGQQVQELKSSPPLEGIRHVRRIIRKWSSPALRQKIPRP
ncbi:zinc finger C3HC-type protein 1-like [Liolophura sinensis]|uniref:zinc finger C3HC-type protein 1-like n=1 Tax=Liolophura sinensis TaxID=3198878 RepID=UPI003159497A